jgi:hypothetical protein
MTVIPDKIYLRPESTIFYIITIVKEKSDYPLVTAITGSTVILGGIMNYSILIKRKIITKNIFKNIEVRKQKNQ